MLCTITLAPYVLRKSWVESLWPDEAIWWHRSGSTLVQVMAWCLMTPSHYLNQCWLHISKALGHTHGEQFHKVSKLLFCISQGPIGEKDIVDFLYNTHLCILRFFLMIVIVNFKQSWYLRTSSKRYRSYFLFRDLCPILNALSLWDPTEAQHNTLGSWCQQRTHT